MLETLATFRKGNRRLLVDSADARDVLDRELHAAGRVVARALRRNNRLAPDVRLVEMIGSQRLKAIAVDRVREAEAER